MLNIIGLDFETYCDLDLTKVGQDKYFAHPSFQVLCAGLYHPPLGKTVYDFVQQGELDHERFLREMDQVASQGFIIAHNASFERGCLKKLGATQGLLTEADVLDSAVHSRMKGGSSKLEYAARQFTGEQKLETGLELIKLFSVPNEKNGFQAPTAELLQSDPELLEKWKLFLEYCGQDAKAGSIVTKGTLGLGSMTMSMANTLNERENEIITYDMNQRGWPVDMDLVYEMKEQYETNLQKVSEEFYQELGIDPDDLNLNSSPQLQKWCEARGVRSKSFDSESVDKLIPKLQKRLASMQATDPKYQDFHEVYRMLLTKQELGGTALKKLQVIIDTVGEDGRLRNQYMHVGAGQTYRTSGKGVQMQNLKRLGANMLEDMTDVYDNWYSNEVLGENLRQVFTSSHPDGQLIVGDFSSVESRGLAWLAGADWKIDAFKRGEDMYKIAASGIYNTPYEQVTKAQRQVGKVAELSCGYQGGPNAVARFASIYGVDFTEDERVKLVRDWRDSNPEIVQLWQTIDELLHETVSTGKLAHENLANDLVLSFEVIPTPRSLAELHPGARSVKMVLSSLEMFGTRPVLERVFHGCYTRGRNINIYKPGETKAGPIWTPTFTDRNTKHKRYFDIYGGKIAGILTQSMCRELFFYSLRELHQGWSPTHNWEIIGQFHDEIVVNWWPGTFTLEETMKRLNDAMTSLPDGFEGFPLEADIKSDFRYIK